jgi:hypothetical protein
MKKEDIMSKKEQQANKQIAYLFLVFAVLMVGTLFLEIIGVFILPKVKTIICGTTVIIMTLIPVYLILVLRIQEKWMKYVVVLTFCLTAGVCFIIFTYHVVVMLYIPILVASIYNNKKLLYVTTVANVVIMFIVHIIAPFVTVNVDDPFYTVERSLLFGFLPRIAILILIVTIAYANILRFNSTINNVLEYSEELEKSTNGLKRIF